MIIVFQVEILWKFLVAISCFSASFLPEERKRVCEYMCIALGYVNIFMVMVIALNPIALVLNAL
jgi:hypothetical protein